MKLAASVPNTSDKKRVDLNMFMLNGSGKLAILFKLNQLYFTNERQSVYGSKANSLCNLGNQG